MQVDLNFLKTIDLLELKMEEKLFRITQFTEITLNNAKCCAYNLHSKYALNNMYDERQSCFNTKKVRTYYDNVYRKYNEV